MKFFRYIYILFFFNGFSQELTLAKANHLATLPIKCLQQEYPNKLGQLLLDSTEIKKPKQLHPAFYGCFDWHSSVHGHWSLVYLLKKFPDLNNRQEIINKLKINLSKENVLREVDYFKKEHEETFERTYGWTWLLKLQLELETSKEPYLKELSKNLKPLTELIIERYLEFLPKLNYPIRAGTHANTAFGLSYAWDYAVYSNNYLLQSSIKFNALRLFEKDQECPFNWEPSGTDFLSPCMEEISIMQRVLPEKDFLQWLSAFAKPLFDPKFTWETAKVSDRLDGHLVHLDGLNFSRASALFLLSKQYPKHFSHLKNVAQKHLEFSLPAIIDGNYEGEHWLASFALRVYEEQE